MKLSFPGRFNKTHPARADKEKCNPTENHLESTNNQAQSALKKIQEENESGPECSKSESPESLADLLHQLRLQHKEKH